jgi:hypothetical protein
MVRMRAHFRTSKCEAESQSRNLMTTEDEKRQHIHCPSKTGPGRGDTRNGKYNGAARFRAPLRTGYAAIGKAGTFRALQLRTRPQLSAILRAASPAPDYCF